MHKNDKEIDFNKENIPAAIVTLEWETNRNRRKVFKGASITNDIVDLRTRPWQRDDPNHAESNEQQHQQKMIQGNIKVLSRQAIKENEKNTTKINKVRGASEECNGYEGGNQILPPGKEKGPNTKFKNLNT